MVYFIWQLTGNNLIYEKPNWCYTLHEKANRATTNS